MHFLLSTLSQVWRSLKQHLRSQNEIPEANFNLEVFYRKTKKLPLRHMKLKVNYKGDFCFYYQSESLYVTLPVFLKGNGGSCLC